MSDSIEDVTVETPEKKKGKLRKIILMVVGFLVLVGGGLGAGLYAASIGLIGGAHTAESGPKLVAKSEQKRGQKEEGAAEEPAASHAGGKATPAGSGGEKFASNYYAMEKEFTSNLQDSPRFIQVGIAISTPYDDTVIEHLRTNDLAIRSAVLMALGDTTEEQVMTSEGKHRLAIHLTHAINDTLKQKEGFGGVGNVYFTNFVVQ